jgi:predicted sulfurtransferase
MNSIILFYKYIFIEHPNTILKWQQQLCTQLALKGRIILAHEGINGTLGGTHENLELYKQEMLAHLLFGQIDFKQTNNTGDHFPRLRVVVKKEIVNLGIDPSLLPADQCGTHLDPAQAHNLIAQKPDNLLIIDCRNKVESAIGTMLGAIKPNIAHFRDFPTYIDQHLDDLKNKRVLMYCTGGVRCERASAYIKSKGIAQEVYQIKGGIHRYIEQFPDGFFRGKNYVFDGRTAIEVTRDILSTCYICQSPCDDYTNCLLALCNRHFICCQNCLQKYGNTCSALCYDMIINQNASKRPNPCKIYALQ